MLLIDGVRYRLWTPKDEEKQFHPMIKEHFKEIFGSDSIYFDFRQALKTKSGIGSIPDAYVITLSKPCQWYVVENELAVHQVYQHIVPQVSKFMRGIENFSSKMEVIDAFFNEITRDKVKKAEVEKMVQPKEIHQFLFDLTVKPPKIAVIIDEITEEVKEAILTLKKLGVTEVVEFKTYTRENAEGVHIHSFEPIFELGISGGKGEKEGKEKEPVPEHRQSYEKKLAWVDANVREVVKDLTNQISALSNVVQRPSSTDCCFYKGKPSSKSIFAVFMLTQKLLKVRIRADPNTFKDPQKWVKDKVFNWFIKQGQEREFEVKGKEQVAYAMELIQQSYNISGQPEK
jgi:predicted transport protein